MWELAVLGCLILFIAGVAMRKNKRSEFMSYSSGDTVDTDKLAQTIVAAVGKEFRDALKEFKEDLKTLTTGTSNSSVCSSGGSLHAESVEIDDSIIPTDLTINVESTNFEGATKEEKVIDKGLGKSKSKLVALRKQQEK